MNVEWIAVWSDTAHHKTSEHIATGTAPPRSTPCRSTPVLPAIWLPSEVTAVSRSYCTFPAAAPANSIASRLAMREEVFEYPGREKTYEAVVRLHHLEAVHIARRSLDKIPGLQRTA